MKRKKVMLELFALFFTAALFLAAYVLLEMRGDLLAIGGAGIVLLITAYLLLDSFFEYRALIAETKVPAAKEAEDGTAAELLKRFEELENVQKAVYTVTKRSNTENLEVLHEIDNRLYELQEALERLTTAVSAGVGGSNVEHRILQTEQSLLELVKACRQDQQNGTKMIIKYSKENARQVAENAHTNTEMTLSELHTMLDPLIEELSEQGPWVRGVQGAGLQEAAAASQPLQEPVQEEIPLPKAAQEEAPTPELTQEEIPLPKAIQEELPQPETIQEEPPLPEALQGLISDDPNKALTPEEIAAMFAAVGQ